MGKNKKKEERCINNFIDRDFKSFSRMVRKDKDGDDMEVLIFSKKTNANLIETIILDGLIREGII